MKKSLSFFAITAALALIAVSPAAAFTSHSVVSPASIRSSVTDGIPGSKNPGGLTDGIPGSKNPGSLTDGIPGSKNPGGLTDGIPGSKNPGSLTDGIPGSKTPLN